MRKLLIRWIVMTVCVIAASYVSQLLNLGFSVDTSSFEKVMQLFIGVAILGFLNATLGKILKLLTLPLNCLTLGLFSLVVNAFILWLAAGTGFGMKISGDLGQQFLAALVSSLIISFLSGVLNTFVGDDDKNKDD
jgi:putative membrane protein